MGRAARANRCSPDSGLSEEALAIARMRRLAGQVKTQAQFDRLVNHFPALVRDQVRVMLRPYVVFDPSAIASESIQTSLALREADAHG